ncbi:enoyl-CoA hydratase/isomerase family protein [Mycolicibacterium sp. GCM10028919]|uniref:enoyl-CoA hydratase/isomerase family protein n=1 Tax=Mycolicibacterium sp. GCM10028919 TaxID=3273401 RepID=UPI0036163904
MLVQIDDDGGVRTLTLNRPEALNAFNEALYDATTAALLDADADPAVAVVVLTGTGRAFSAGNDLVEMQARITDPDFQSGEHGFPGMIEALTALRKPLILAVNGLGVGIGATILGYADLVFMAAGARLKCPFTSLGVAPEAASSYLLPRLIGRQNAAWMLLSSEWVDADEALRMGLAWKVCDPEDLMAEAAQHAAVLASRSIPSLMAVKETIVDPTRDAIAEAAKREYAKFEVLLGSVANADALSDFADRKTQ